MRQRRHYWEHASYEETLHKFLEIIYITEYPVWHELFLMRRPIADAFTYKDIIRGYYDLTPNNKLKFYNHCYTIGIYDRFIRILGEHLPQ